MPLRKPIDHLFGQRFGRWTIVREAAPPLGEESHRYIECRCDCGTVKIAYLPNLTRGASRSCGCWRDEKTRVRNRTHGMSRWPEYKIWAGMKKRCHNPNSPSYADYGGRGIKVCQRWQSFESFFEDMGRRPSNTHTIERINNDGHYEHSNCRWATKGEQTVNTRRNRYILFQGERLTLADWARRCNLPHTVIVKRLKRGWPIARALTAPLMANQYR